MTAYLHALPEGFQLGNYELQRVLGAGAFGITYLAFDRKGTRNVAIKEYLPVDVAIRRVGQDTRVMPMSAREKGLFDWGLSRFLSEAKLLRRFSQENIVRVLRHFRANGTGYMVMEHVDGSTLASIFKNKGTLDEDELRALLIPILDGLRTIHDTDYLHRDIKPSNIVVRKNGSPVILDFGSARHALIARSRSVTSLVTPGYSPIEQYSSSGKQGPWSDIYALGAVLYRALLGSPPPPAPERLLDDNIEGWTKNVSGVSQRFLNSIDSSLAIKGAERPQTVAEWRRLLPRTTAKRQFPQPEANQSVERIEVKPSPVRNEVQIAAIRRRLAASLAGAAHAVWGLLNRVALALSTFAVPAKLGNFKALAANDRAVRIGLGCSIVGVLSLTAWWVAILAAGDRLDANEPPAFAVNTVAPVEIVGVSPTDSIQNESTQLLREYSARLWTKVFAGHSGAIQALAVSPDGRFLATTSDDATTQIWNLSTGEKLLTLRGHESAVTAVSFLAEGERVATGSADSTVRIWDTASGAHHALLSGHDARVNSVAVSPDGVFLLTASNDGTARLWRIEDGLHLATLAGHTSSVVSAQYSVDGTLIATGAFDNSVRLWDSSLGQHLATFTGSGAVASTAFSPDGTGILVGYHNGDALVWGIESGEVFEMYDNHESAVHSAVWSPDGRCIAIASHDKTLSIWSSSPPRLIERFRADDHPLSAVAFVPGGRYVATASSGGEVRLWEVPEGCT